MSAGILDGAAITGWWYQLVNREIDLVRNGLDELRCCQWRSFDRSSGVNRAKPSSKDKEAGLSRRIEIEIMQLLTSTISTTISGIFGGSLTISLRRSFFMVGGVCGPTGENRFVLPWVILADLAKYSR